MTPHLMTSCQVRRVDVDSAPEYPRVKLSPKTLSSLDPGILWPYNSNPIGGLTRLAVLRRLAYERLRRRIILIFAGLTGVTTS